MKNYLLPVLYTLVAVLLFATCVREIDYTRDDVDKSTLVVSGGFYDGEGPFQLRLTHPTDYNKRDFEPVPGAAITLSDDQGHTYFYQELDTGLYQLSGVRGVPGHIYTLDIRLADGTTYRSRPQKMLELLPLDSAKMQVEFLEDITAEGKIVRIPFALVYGFATTADQTGERYQRWESENTYIFNEIFTGAPFDEQKQCFITETISYQLTSIADPGLLQAGTVQKAYAGRRRIDHAFELRNCFSVYQRTINKETYDYWTRVKQVTEPTGTIFDPPPAIIRGNIENTGDPDRPAFGFFEVASSDTAHVCANRGDLPFDVVAYIPQYCNGNILKKPECLDCILLANSTWQKPEWW